MRRSIGRWLLLGSGLLVGGCGPVPGEPASGAPAGRGATVREQGTQQVFAATPAVSRRIRRELEQGYPDNTPSVDALQVQERTPDGLYPFTAQLTVIGIAGPNFPMRYLVSGSYDPRSDQVVILRRQQL